MSPDRTFTISLSFTFSQLPWIGFLWKVPSQWVWWTLGILVIIPQLPKNSLAVSPTGVLREDSVLQSCAGLPRSPTAVCVILPYAPLVTPPPLDNCIPFSEEAGWAKAARDGREEQAGPLWPHQDIWQKKVSSIALLVVVYLYVSASFLGWT